MNLESWRPPPLSDRDPLDAAPSARFSALLGRGTPASALPPLWHWFHFPDWPGQDALGDDGHPAAGHFLPPMPDRRRMIAGGRLTVHGPLTFGRPVTRARTVAAVTPKRGRTGEMVFVTVRSELRQDGELRAVEEQDVVYRSGEDAGRAALATIDLGGVPVSDAPWQLSLTPDPVLLFRFSALTSNAHRIHYDHPYVTGIEGYPGLVVHGPLLVLLMLELVRDRDIAALDYRLRRPVFAGEQLLATGTPDGNLRIVLAREPAAATARVSFR